MSKDNIGSAERYHRFAQNEVIIAKDSNGIEFAVDVSGLKVVFDRDHEECENIELQSLIFHNPDHSLGKANSPVQFNLINESSDFRNK